MMNMEARLDRLEAKIDKLNEALVKLAEIDIKIENMAAHNTTQDNRLNKHSQTIDDHAVKVATVIKSSGANEWFIRLLIATLVGGLAFIMRG